MQWVKVPLVGFALFMLIALFRNRQRVELRAGTRVVTIGLFVLAVISIVAPGITQRAATFLGVGRGTDLLLYGLVVVFTLTSMGLYFRLRESDERLRRLVRSIAINEALQELERTTGSADDRPSGPGAASRG
ncbi:conserved membrane hypothetical protein [Nostocoides japonicum T1-X7]|uniref:DUF2304 domain-containing protein n=1 Tax=Nostocoides japonicum T1-X7 TaxID=1194083 RepID=A0A077LX42_9MICO|nr:DUF2304 domain-containing protein [Tetrasphaera japonica]CCH77452.1 conserved membrane hypothetical protein [Tetrasphaera japonica T1-X7]